MNMSSFFVVVGLCLCATRLDSAEAVCKLVKYATDVLGYCSCEDIAAGKRVTLAAFAGSQRFAVKKDPYFYYYQPCLGFNMGGYNDVSVIQNDTLNSYNLGDAASIATAGDATSLVFAYSGMSKDGKERVSRVHLICNVEQAEGSFAFVNQTSPSDSDISYTFTLTSSACCAQDIGAPSAGSLSTGSILVIVFFMLLVVYIVSGLLYMRYRVGADGLEMIPNLTFWKDLPWLVKDGTCYAIGLCRCGGKSGVYDSI